MEWWTISLILCVFGFLKEFRPNEPFVTNYLTGPWKNFTEAQVNQEIFPVGTYCYFGILVPVFLLTDLVRYKPVIVLSGLSGTATFLLLRYGSSLRHMQIVQFSYGLLLATEVAYYTYIYAKVERHRYQRVTSHTRTAYLLGRFSAAVVAQLVTSFGYMDYQQLNYLSIASLGIGTICALYLPSVSRSIYFDSAESSNASLVARVRHAYYLLWKDFVKAYSNGHVLKWSVWWSSATCGFLQVINYIQLLWEDAVDKGDPIYNGVVEACLTIGSALVVFGIGKLQFNWPLIGEGILSIFSIGQGFLLLACYISYNISILYVAYGVFGIIYHSIITIANFEVAKHISEDSYGLIFGINTLLALLMQSSLTFIVVSKNGLHLDIKSQYMVYGGYFLALGAIYMVMNIFTIVHYRKSRVPMKLWLKNSDLDTK